MRKKIWNLLRIVLSVGLMISSLLVSCGYPVLRPLSGQPSRHLAEELINKYSPILHLYGQERFYPKEVASTFNNSYLRGGTGNPISPPIDPTTAILTSYNTTNYFLDMQGAGPNTFPLSNFTSFNSTVYARIIAYPNYYLIQYWFFYPFDDWEPPAGAFYHEGDWEVIVVVANNTSRQIEWAGYAQHTAGFKYLPGELQIDQTDGGAHPKVYIGRGSHASYANPGLHNTFSIFGAEFSPFFTDVTIENSVPLRNVSGYNITILDSSALPQWLGWMGIWGEGSGLSRPPNSPGRQGKKWTDPFGWSQDPTVALTIGGAHSPVNLHAYDRLGNHVGLNSTGGIDLNIPGTYLYQPSDNKSEYIIIANEEDLTFNITAERTVTGTELFDFKLGRYIKSKKTSVVVSYEKVQITQNTVAILETRRNPRYIMNIYENGILVRKETPKISPSVTTEAPDLLTSNSVRLKGKLNSVGTSTTVNVSIDWGLTSDYGNSTAHKELTAVGILGTLFGSNISGLSANTSYHFRVKAVGDDNITVYGNDQRFTTLP